MLSYMDTPRRSNHAPHSSSPLNPQRSSSPPPACLSSPTPVKGSLPRFRLPSISTPATARAGPSRPPGSSSVFGSSSPTRSPQPQGTRPFSPRYTRTMPSSSLSARRPRGGDGGSGSSPSARSFDALSSPPPGQDVFGHQGGATPTQNAMWRDRLQRRMADRERRKAARDSDLARRRGLADFCDDDAAERQAQADDEELFRRLMVLQRRREQHSLAQYDGGGGAPGVEVEFWADELDALAREERAICAHLDQMDTDSAGEYPGLGRGTASQLSAVEEEKWAHEAAEAEAAEAAMHGSYGNGFGSGYGDDYAASSGNGPADGDGGGYAVETAHGYGTSQWEEAEPEPEMELGPEDWARLAAVEAAMEMDVDEAMDVEA